jgi:hypothetical protein
VESTGLDVGKLSKNYTPQGILSFRFQGFAQIEFGNRNATGSFANDLRAAMFSAVIRQAR